VFAVRKSVYGDFESSCPVWRRGDIGWLDPNIERAWGWTGITPKPVLAPLRSASASDSDEWKPF
jgi:hypothetical protein